MFLEHYLLFSLFQLNLSIFLRVWEFLLILWVFLCFLKFLSFFVCLFVGVFGVFLWFFVCLWRGFLGGF